MCSICKEENHFLCASVADSGLGDPTASMFCWLPQVFSATPEQPHKLQFMPLWYLQVPCCFQWEPTTGNNSVDDVQNGTEVSPHSHLAVLARQVYQEQKAVKNGFSPLKWAAVTQNISKQQLSWVRRHHSQWVNFAYNSLLLFSGLGTWNCALHNKVACLHE